MANAMANAMTVVDLANDDVPRQVSFGGASNASTNEPLEFKGTRSDKQQRLLRIRQGTLKIYEHGIEKLQDSSMPTRRFVGFQLHKVLRHHAELNEDGTLDDSEFEADRNLLEQVRDRQISVWDTLTIMSTLMISLLFNEISDSPDAHESFDEYSMRDGLLATYVILANLCNCTFMLSAISSTVFRVYTCCLCDEDDTAWFFINFRFEVPSIMTILALIFYHLLAATRAFIAHGVNAVGISAALIWVVTLALNLGGYMYAKRMFNARHQKLYERDKKRREKKRRGPRFSRRSRASARESATVIPHPGQLKDESTDGDDGQ